MLCQGNAAAHQVPVSVTTCEHASVRNTRLPVFRDFPPEVLELSGPGTARLRSQTLMQSAGLLHGSSTQCRPIVKAHATPMCGHTQILAARS